MLVSSYAVLLRVEVGKKVDLEDPSDDDAVFAALSVWSICTKEFLDVGPATPVEYCMLAHALMNPLRTRPSRGTHWEQKGVRIILVLKGGRWVGGLKTIILMLFWAPSF